jgi:hypothetical protein
MPGGSEKQFRTRCYAANALHLQSLGTNPHCCLGLQVSCTYYLRFHTNGVRYTWNEHCTPDTYLEHKKPVAEPPEAIVTSKHHHAKASMLRTCGRKAPPRILKFPRFRLHHLFCQPMLVDATHGPRVVSGRYFDHN